MAAAKSESKPEEKKPETLEEARKRGFGEGVALAIDLCTNRFAGPVGTMIATALREQLEGPKA